jgi:prepilin signal peptidase PulO-like enzyme (type II secretory pathway)
MDLLELINVPMTWWYTYAFGLGVIIGSFLNVYIYRFHTGKSLSGSSHCMSCGKGLRWYELIPLISWLGLRGRCSGCGSLITSRYFLVELVTGLLFLFTLTITTDLISVLLWWYIFSVLLAITVYDLYHFIIPDRLTIYLGVTTVLLFSYQNIYLANNLDSLLPTLAAATLGSLFFFTLWFISKGMWLGFGDVKLALPLGILVGSEYVFSFVVLSFWVGAAISIFIIGFNKLKRGKDHLQIDQKAITMKSAVPFAPFLVASSLIIIFTNFNALALFSFA